MLNSPEQTSGLVYLAVHKKRATEGISVSRGIPSRIDPINAATMGWQIQHDMPSSPGIADEKVFAGPGVAGIMCIFPKNHGATASWYLSRSVMRRSNASWALLEAPLRIAKAATRNNSWWEWSDGFIPSRISPEQRAPITMMEVELLFSTWTIRWELPSCLWLAVHEARPASFSGFNAARWSVSNSAFQLRLSYC